MSLLDEVRKAMVGSATGESFWVSISVEARDALVELADAQIARRNAKNAWETEVALDREDAALERLRR